MELLKCLTSNKFTLHLTPGLSRPSAAWTPGIKRSHRRRVRGLWYSLHGYVRVAHVYSMFGVAVHTHRRKPNKFTLHSTPGPSQLQADLDSKDSNEAVPTCLLVANLATAHELRSGRCPPGKR